MVRWFLIGACFLVLVAGLFAFGVFRIEVVSAISQVVSSQSGSSRVVGRPTVSVELIKKVLQVYRSPAMDEGQVLYDGGVKYGIDPVYALAFFQHESGFGRQGIAVTTHSLGNIRCTTGYVCVGGFRKYGSFGEGFVDWYRLISEQYVKQWHLATVEQIVPRYAPRADHNDPQGYIQAVNYAVKTWRSGQVVVS